MTRTGIFVTPEELAIVRTAFDVSGMFLSGGVPMGDPGYEVERLRTKYHMPDGTGLDLKTGEFVRKTDGQGDREGR